MSLFIAARAAILALKDPTRQDMVAALGETTGLFALKKMHEKMLLDKTGRQILSEKPLVSSKTVNLAYLRSLPESTFGKRYTQFLDIHKVSPDTRTQVKYIQDTELAYVMLRYRQNHDFFHTLLALDTSVLSEIVVKWFEMVQTGLPMTTLSSFVGPFRLSKEERDVLFEVYAPWAIRSARNSTYLMNVMYESHFHEDIEELRRRLGVEPFPGIDEPL